MKAMDKISNAERALHAAKGKLKTLKNKRWIDVNYKQVKTDLDTDIQQAETEITQTRRNLQQLYNQHLTK